MCIYIYIYIYIYVHHTQSAQISEKEDGHNVCHTCNQENNVFPWNHQNGFVTTPTLGM